MPARTERGFTLMEAAIAIAVIAILAGTAIPFALKNLNQAKEQRARTEMKLLFEACFGATDRVVPNARHDWGQAWALAAGATVNLAKLTNRLAAPAPNPPAFNLNGAPFRWGWNGPYWNGAVRTVAGQQAPSDPWGRPYLMSGAGGNAYQIRCTGPDGAPNTPDDLVYPANAFNQAAQVAQVAVTVVNNRAAAVTATVTLRNRNTTAFAAVGGLGVSPPIAAGGGVYAYPNVSGVIPGPATLQVQVAAAGVNFTETLVLAPGEVRSLRYVIN